MNIGFYIIDADHSEKCNSIISTINELVENNPYANVILFNSQYNRVDNFNKKFPILHINQAKYFRGVLVCFDAKSAMITKTFPAPTKQILYVEDLSWSNDPSLPALFWQGIYNNTNIKLIAKNQEISDLLEICWLKPIAIINDINAKDLYEAIK